jgi:hypothetical protein
MHTAFGSKLSFSTMENTDHTEALTIMQQGLAGSVFSFGG